MVRKAFVALSLLAMPALAQESTPPIWQRVADGGADFRVYYKDVTFDPSGGVSLWMRGEHSRDQSVDYRASLWKLYLACKGSVTLLASTTYAADGSAKSWDGYQTTAIRPDTIYSSLQDQFCKK